MNIAVWSSYPPAKQSARRVSADQLPALLAKIKANATRLVGAEAGAPERDEALRKVLEAELDQDAARLGSPKKRSPELAAAARSVPGTGQILAFHFFDILLSAGLLAGGADPISRLMKLLRDLLDQTNKKVTESKSTT